MIKPPTQSPRMTLGGGTPGMKHSAFNESYIKPIDSADSKGQYEKYIGKVFPEFKIPTITSNSRYSSLVLNILSIIISQSEQKRFAA